MNVIVTENIEAGRDVPDHVVSKDHVFDDRPRRVAVLVADGEENREAILRVRPVVFEQIALNQYSTRILQLEQVLDRPRHTGELWMIALPMQGFRERVADDLDIGRHEV